MSRAEELAKGAMCLWAESGTPDLIKDYRKTMFHDIKRALEEQEQEIHEQYKNKLGEMSCIVRKLVVQLDELIEKD